MNEFCPYFKNGISFHYKGISFCNKLGNDHFYPYGEDCLERFLADRADISNIIENCIGCSYLTNTSNPNSTKINFIEIAHWFECNCACFYCSNRADSHLKITDSQVCAKVDIVPYLKKLKELDLIDENAHVSFVGGEPTILKEFSDLIDIVVENGCSASLLSNGILYDKNIVRAMNVNDNTYLTVSLDCGCSETFKKIKQVDKFDEVITTLSKYVAECKNVDNIILKYIILENCNDNVQEIEMFIEKLSKIGIKNFMPSIEFCHSGRNLKIPDNICEKYNYMKQSLKEKNLIVSTYDFVDTMIKNSNK